MKFILWSLLFLVSGSAFASQNMTPDFVCMNEMPTTAFYATPYRNVDGDEFTDFQVKHFFGAKNSPIFNGVITGNDFAALKKKADLVKKLGDAFTIRFKKINCEKHGDELFTCGSASGFTVNGVKLDSAGFITKMVDTKIYEYTFKSNVIEFSFTYKGESFEIPMSFNPDECRFNN